VVNPPGEALSHEVSIAKVYPGRKGERGMEVAHGLCQMIARIEREVIRKGLFWQENCVTSDYYTPSSQSPSTEATVVSIGAWQFVGTTISPAGREAKLEHLSVKVIPGESVYSPTLGAVVIIMPTLIVAASR
jgi:hypothetical protein